MSSPADNPACAEPAVSAVAAATPGDWRVNNFDLIRLLAALQVAVVHALAAFHPAGFLAFFTASVMARFPGVPIFFVISGLLVSKSFEQSDSLREYARNRCLRIFPALWVCLVLTIPVIVALGTAIGPITPGSWLAWWAGEMTIFESRSVAFFSALPGAGHTLNFSLWTIPVELEFYILLPVLYYLMRRRPRLGRTVLITLLLSSLALVLVWAYGHDRYPQLTRTYVLGETLAPYLWMFLLGVLIQRNWTRLRGWFAGRAVWWLLGYLALCVVGTRLQVGFASNAPNPLFMLVLAGVVLSGAMSAPGLADRILRRRDLSYGLYIYHALVIQLMVHFAAPSGWRSVGAALLIALGLAFLSWTLVERPFLRQKRKALHSPPGAAPAPAAHLVGMAP
jgi:peptidoglycan/LPS O-acetylase OafA/YrhL